MNRINKNVGMCHLPCTDLAQKSKAEQHHSPRAGAKIFARRIGDVMQMPYIQKSGAQSCARPPRSFEAVAQAGRSMIEMLGVLAIIGVLTIGGLMGYRYAMNKHKANLILNDVSLAMADLTVQDPDGGAIARQAVAFNPESGLAMESERTEDGNNIVYVNGVAKAVCQILIQIKPTDAYENIYDGDLNALTSCNDNQTMAFGSKDSGETPVTPECQNNSDCAADEICQNGHCVVKPIPTDPCDPNPCSNGGICSNGECTCINGFSGEYCDEAPECVVDTDCSEWEVCEDYVCVCGKFEGCVQQASDCKCEKCETAYIKKDGKCEKCTAPKVPNADQTTCECPKVAGCVTQNADTCACDKCDADYIKKDGKCEKCTAPKVPNADQTACECPKVAGCVTQNADTCACDKCDAEYIKKDGKCEKCTAPKVPNADQTACECPKIENCKEYSDSTCACDTCEDGFEVVDGKCVEVSRCAADAPVQCGTNCCPEGSTCDGDKCCWNGECCPAGWKQQLEHDSVLNMTNCYCEGEYMSAEEACKQALKTEENVYFKFSKSGTWIATVFDGTCSTIETPGGTYAMCSSFSN